MWLKVYLAFPKLICYRRMLLYDSGIDLEEIKQLLLSGYRPLRNLVFAFSQVEILPSDFTVRAIALAGGSEVAVSLGLVKNQNLLAECGSNLTASDFGFTSRRN